MTSADYDFADHRALADALTAERPLHALVSALHRVSGAPVAVIDLRGGVLVSVPARAEWSTEEWVAASPASGGLVAGGVLRPVELEGEPVAVLCARGQDMAPALLSFAATLAGIELSRRHAILSGRRELLGQVLEDIVAGRPSEEEGARRLSEHGLDVHKPHEIVVGSVACPPRRLRSYPWNLHTLLTQQHDPHVRAVVDDRVVLVVPEGAGLFVARLCHEHLTSLGPDARVGVSRARVGVLGLRLGYFDARSALAEGYGVHVHRTQDLTTTLLIAGLEAGLPLGDLAAEALAPLAEYDRRNSTSLVATLRRYLAEDGDAETTAAALYVHRNTLRNRLRLIEELTGRSVSSPSGRAHFWLAVSGLDVRTAGDLSALLDGQGAQ
ncbi:PucR family transcriptional regulator [Streptomyces sp. NPDC001212]|uniref:PucR family transcriptional regulator n=1 Tax=Streptomyces sp. HYC2 TaxID=2955207 RepID=UPI00247FA34B|nr:helix-turn-helix domain-containing protein [Streptomyces sp. HYC2]